MQQQTEIEHGHPAKGSDKERQLLLIVIVNFKTARLTSDCLSSVAREVGHLSGCRAVVVDNGSRDGSVESITKQIEQEGWQDWASVIELDRNYGFSAANNRGIRAFPDHRYVLLLNSDTIVHLDCLEKCIDVMEEDKMIGAMSCNVLNRDGSIQNVARKFPTPARQAFCALGLPWRLPRLFGWADPEDITWDRATTAKDVDWLGGEFLFVRGEALRSVGGLDEEFFFSGEDTEFCFRLRRHGYRCRFDPRSSITHFGGASSEKSGRTYRRNSWRVRYLVQGKCYGPLATHLARGVDTIAWCGRLAALFCLGRRKTGRFEVALENVQILTRSLAHGPTQAGYRKCTKKEIP